MQPLVDEALKHCLYNALDAAIELHGAEFGHIQLYDPDRRSLRIAAHRGFGAAALSRFELAGADAQAPFFHVLDMGAPLAIKDMVEDSSVNAKAGALNFAPYRALAIDLGFRAMQAVPLPLPDGAPTGVLTTCCREPSALSARVMRITERLARQTGALIGASLGEAQPGEARRGAEIWHAEGWHAEDELRKSQNRLRVLVEGIPQLVWRAARIGEWTWSSPQWSAFTGLSEDASRGLGWQAALHPEDRDAAMAAWRMAEAKGFIEVDLRILNAEQGRHRWFQTRAVPVRNARGGIIEWLGTSTDIEDQMQARAVLSRSHEELEALVAARTRDLLEAVEALHDEIQERERIEETLRQSQKMQAVGQLTGGIAHDFNNMLQGISSSLEIVQRRIEQQRAAEAMRFLEAARKSVTRAAGLTQRLLAFARKQTLNAKPVNLDELARGMEELIRRTVGPSVQVELKMRDGEWQVLCDENQMENALLNLAINARDAMPDGGRLTILTEDVALSPEDLAGEVEAVPGEYSVIAVRDTGAGMPPEVMERAFEPFFTTKALGQGTGLGLSQIYGFVRQSKGLVRIDSAEGRGTTISLFLPRAATDETPPPEPAEGATVLLVEDEAELRDMVAGWLRELGYQVIEAADGAGAIRLLRGPDRLDLLLADIRLPGGLNGREVAEAARARHPDLPVLFITGYPEAAFPDGLPADTKMALIDKPFALDLLAARIQAMLKR